MDSFEDRLEHQPAYDNPDPEVFTQSIPEHISNILSNARDVAEPGARLKVDLEGSDGPIELTQNSLHAVKPSNTPGIYEIQKKIDKKKVAKIVTVGLVTGAAILGATVAYKKAKNRNKS